MYKYKSTNHADPDILSMFHTDSNASVASTSKAPRLRGGILQRQRTQGSWQSFAYWFLGFGDVSSSLPEWKIGKSWQMRIMLYGEFIFFEI